MLPVAQLDPPNPSGHEQLYEQVFEFDVHWPPFKHGLLEHGLVSM